MSDLVPKRGKNIQRIDVQGFDFKTFYKNLDKDAAEKYILIAEDPKQLFRRIRQSCELIKAAGGLVKSAKGNYLFIYRNKRWDLPKGKTEKGERMKEAAVREVEEECGVKIQRNDGKICRTYHVYPLNNKLVLKKTNWYAMTVKGETKLVPQKEEGITKAVWLDDTSLGPVFKNTYPSIVQVLEEGGMI